LDRSAAKCPIGVSERVSSSCFNLRTYETTKNIDLKAKLTKPKHQPQFILETPFSAMLGLLDFKVFACFACSVVKLNLRVLCALCVRLKIFLCCYL